MNDNSIIKKIILKSAYIITITLIITVVAMVILKYQVEGEKNMPFKLSSIIIISNAEGYQEKENPDYRWDADIYQNNDIYLNIEKNKNYNKDEIIKSIIIDNIRVDRSPIIGNIEFYRPSNEDINIFSYKEKYKINDKIEYIGDINSDLKNLKISNQGTTLIFRVVNRTGKKYMSNEENFEHNGKILNKIGVSYEDVKMEISFDLIINLESDIAFKTNIKLELPIGDITKEGSSSKEITDMSSIIFKREQI